jgi:hypothetical protein
MPATNTLHDIYLCAIELTENASRCLKNNDHNGASQLLLERQQLLRRIQQCVSKPPVWGSDDAQDKAAINYIKADQALRELIANCAR